MSDRERSPAYARLMAARRGLVADLATQQAGKLISETKDRPPQIDVDGLRAVLDRMGQDWGRVLAYDMGLPKWPEAPYTPMRNVFPRKVCYTLPSGNRVHVKPGCRC